MAKYKSMLFIVLIAILIGVGGPVSQAMKYPETSKSKITTSTSDCKAVSEQSISKEITPVFSSVENAERIPVLEIQAPEYISPPGADEKVKEITKTDYGESHNKIPNFYKGNRMPHPLLC